MLIAFVPDVRGAFLESLSGFRISDAPEFLGLPEERVVLASVVDAASRIHEDLLVGSLSGF